MTKRVAFRRVVVGLHQTAPDKATVGIAAEFAELMRLDLFGLFIEDPGMLGVAGRPEAREFRLLGRRWQQLDPDSLAREVELCAMSARRMFEEAARRRGIASRFEVVRSAIGKAIQAISHAGDIVIIAEPRHPAGRSIAPFPQLLKAAFESAATILFLPRRIARPHGPVVAIAMSPDDASLAAAAAIAAAASEHLIVLEAFEPPATETGGQPDLAREGGLTVARLRVAPRALADLRALSSAMEGLRERMIVATRAAFGDGSGDRPAELAALRSVPVLLVGSEAEGAAEPPGAAS